MAAYKERFEEAQGRVHMLTAERDELRARLDKLPEGVEVAWTTLAVMLFPLRFSTNPTQPPPTVDEVVREVQAIQDQSSDAWSRHDRMVEERDAAVERESTWAARFDRLIEVMALRAGGDNGEA